jgi:acetylglutamate kinase
MEPNVSNIDLVVKIGGSTLGNHDTTIKDLVELQSEGYRIVVVHGGGNVISDWMNKQNLTPVFIDGLRVTDRPSLDIVVAVLTGLINKEMVSLFNQLGGKAIGISGVDGRMLEGIIPDPQLGYVGQVITINTSPINAILDSGYMPMVSPVGVHVLDDSNNSGIPLNINGDTSAGELAKALSPERLVFLTDVPGVMDNSGRVIPKMNMNIANNLIRSGAIKGGMIPKLGACINALESVKYADIIDGRIPGSLRDCVNDKKSGTRIMGSKTQ